MILSLVSFYYRKEIHIEYLLEGFEWNFQVKSLELSQKGALCMGIEDFADIYMEIANVAGDDVRLVAGVLTFTFTVPAN
jgi:hypothetical protein